MSAIGSGARGVDDELVNLALIALLDGVRGLDAVARRRVVGARSWPELSSRRSGMASGFHVLANPSDPATALDATDSRRSRTGSSSPSA